MRKKLKDLKKGDRIWLYGFTGTTPIYVEKVKRQGEMCMVTVKWDEVEHVCFGHALAWTCVGYWKRFRAERIFTTDYEDIKRQEDKKEANKNYIELGKQLIEILNTINKLKNEH